MEKIDLSVNSKALKSAYDKVVRGDPDSTYTVFSVNKNGVTDVSATGAGELTEFVEEFTDGQVQFGFARVTVPGSDVFKNVLLGWCPDNAPAKMRLSFAANFAELSKVFPGYHIQVTARDLDDLDVDQIVSRVGAAAGARYTFHAGSAGSSGSGSGSGSGSAKPSATFKPTPSKPTPIIKPKVVAPGITPSSFKTPVKTSDDDGWDGEAELKERDFEKEPLQDVPSAYKPTKVNIEQLRSQKSDTISSTPKIAKPPVKESEPEPKSLNDRVKAYQSNDGRLSSLPKPKVSHSVASRYNAVSSSTQPAFGAKPSFGASQSKSDKPEGVFQNHANENGLTPAQLWAQKRGKYKVETSEVEEGVSSLSVQDEPEPVQKSPLPEPIEQESVPEPVKPVSNVVPPKRSLPPVSAIIQPIPPARTSAPAELEELEEEDDVPETSSPAPVLPSRGSVAPSAEVEISEPEEQEESEPLSSNTAIAEYDYEKDEENEIDFKEGDLIVEIEFVDEGWWMGRHSVTGEVGVFPANYVKLNEA